MGRAKNITINVFVSCNCEFRILKLFYALKKINKRDLAKFEGIPKTRHHLVDDIYSLGSN